MPKRKKEDQRLHFRRCHICNGVSESEGALVAHCGHCGKPMAPFYFFDDLDVAPMSDDDFRPPHQQGARSPVRGFTAYW